METKTQLIVMVKELARATALDPVLMCAMVQQESGFNTFALRSESESGFAARYGAEYARIVKASASKNDDKWFRFEDIFYASYGLLQTMYPVIIETFPEMSEQLAFPTQLCDPVIGIGQGCRLFAKKLRTAGGDVEKALLFWNGGGNKDYPAEVLSKKSLFV